MAAEKDQQKDAEPEGLSATTLLPKLIPSGAGREWLERRRATIRPWGSFVDQRRFSRPRNLGELCQRLVRNVEYYQSNYVFVFLGLILYCVVTSPMLLVALAVFFGACYILYLRTLQSKFVLFESISCRPRGKPSPSVCSGWGCLLSLLLAGRRGFCRLLGPGSHPRGHWLPRRLPPDGGCGRGRAADGGCVRRMRPLGPPESATSSLLAPAPHGPAGLARGRLPIPSLGRDSSRGNKTVTVVSQQILSRGLLWAWAGAWADCRDQDRGVLWMGGIQ
uniref:PRA1 family protein n=2 Tax=Caniformia TaxID=379584 RepID=A0A452T5Q6_URSMA